MDMPLKVLGFESGEFTDDKTGEIIRYAKVHCAETVERDGSGMKGVAYKSTPEAAAMLKGQKLPADIVADVKMTPLRNGQFALRVQGFRL